MKEEQITCVANVLAQWNPLGEKANSISDLDGYRIEATDIIMALQIRGKTVKPELIVMEVINQAFDLSLTSQSCIAPAQEIVAIMGKKHQVQYKAPTRRQSRSQPAGLLRLSSSLNL